MRRLDLNPNKKLRGINRYLKQFSNYLQNLEKRSPIKYDNYDYWNEKIWIYEKLLNNKKYQIEVFNKYIQSTRIFSDKNKKDNAIFTIIISTPNLFSSEICVFYSEKYFNDFITPSSDYQKLIPIEKGLIDNLELTITGKYQVLNFKEQIIDEDYIYNGILTIIKFL